MELKRESPTALGARGLQAAKPARRLLERFVQLMRALALLLLLVLALWWTLFFRETLQRQERELAQRDQRIASLDAELDQAKTRVRELANALALLKVDQRVARVEVLSQSGTGPGLRTRLRFEELTADGRPLGPAREFEIDGAVCYFDALVIKFEDSYVERGDALRGVSLVLFRRAFSERQTPDSGFELDPFGLTPAAYAARLGADAPAAFAADLWRRFWDYANDPELAAAQGVRAIHGEAPFIELRPGKRYRLELRASGGLSLKPE